MLNKAYAEMCADPVSFLRHYMVTIAVAGRVSPAPATFTMSAENNSFAGFQTGISGWRGLTKQRQKLRIMKVHPGTTAGPDAVIFQAWCIPMTEMGSPGSAHVNLPGRDGPNIALTSQMSGCTLAIGSPANDGSRFVAHVRPPVPQPTEQTYMAMREAARRGRRDAFFDRLSRPGDQSYGNPFNRATIIGVRRANQWRFYAQTYNLDEQRLFKVERL